MHTKNKAAKRPEASQCDKISKKYHFTTLRTKREKFIFTPKKTFFGLWQILAELCKSFVLLHNLLSKRIIKVLKGFFKGKKSSKRSENKIRIV